MLQIRKYFEAGWVHLCALFTLPVSRNKGRDKFQNVLTGIGCCLIYIRVLSWFTLYYVMMLTLSK